MSEDKRKEYTVLLPIGFSGRREVGEVVELTEAEAKNIGSDYVVRVGKKVEKKEEEKEEKKPTRDSRTKSKK